MRRDIIVSLATIVLLLSGAAFGQELTSRPALTSEDITELMKVKDTEAWSAAAKTKTIEAQARVAISKCLSHGMQKKTAISLLAKLEPIAQLADRRELPQKLVSSAEVSAAVPTLKRLRQILKQPDVSKNEALSAIALSIAYRIPPEEFVARFDASFALMTPKQNEGVKTETLFVLVHLVSEAITQLAASFTGTGDDLSSKQLEQLAAIENIGEFIVASNEKLGGKELPAPIFKAAKNGDIRAWGADRVAKKETPQPNKGRMNKILQNIAVFALIAAAFAGMNFCANLANGKVKFGWKAIKAHFVAALVGTVFFGFGYLLLGWLNETAGFVLGGLAGTILGSGTLMAMMND